ncbi:hypothetical protein OQA88_608 [Cercophora sp. LCS_1]
MASWSPQRALSHRQGWRKTALVNTVLVTILTSTLAILVAVIAANSGSLTKNLFFYQGSCQTSTQINVALHLAINTIAMGIVASSNFFMQVLNAPSRAEVDAAHRNRKMVDIGVQSAKNMWHVSRFKLVSALIFGLSSLPIHLLFNSVVFQSDFLGGNWQTTFAAEPFVDNNTTYSLPGAYLAPSGFWPQYPPEYRDSSFRPGYYGFGERINITQYTNASSPIVSGIARAAGSASNWKRLDPLTCRRQYIACEPRRTYGDVVMVISAGNNTLHKNGWTLEDVVDTSVFNITSAPFWGDLGLLPPANQPNTLWYSALCSTTQDPMRTTGICRTSCGTSIGGEEDFNNQCPVPPRGSEPLDASLCQNSFVRNTSVFSNDKNWTIVNEYPRFYGANDSLALALNNTPFQRDATLKLQHRDGFRVDEFGQWEVEYCLAESVSDRCKVGASGILLLVVTICAALKTVQCLVVLWRLGEDPLVTPGDAIESFLVRPDQATKDVCTLSSHRFSAYWRAQEGVTESEGSWPVPGPRNWRRPSDKLLVSVRPGTWMRVYGLFGVSLAVAVWFFATAVTQLGEKYRVDGERSPFRMTGLDHSYENGLLDATWMPKDQLIPSILLSNTPQVVLSLNYFVYNALWTRMHSELEWNAFALSYRPLRVTSPKGQQTSTYRLQLPYLYSVPLVVGSILLHWLVANAIYLVMIEGDYLTENESGVYINVGYSTGPMLAGIIVCSAMAAVPLLFGIYHKLKGSMTVMGNNSLVISASCHPASSAPDDKLTKLLSPGYISESSAESLALMANAETRTGIGYKEDAGLHGRIALSQGRLKWGEVGSGETLAEEGLARTVKIGHLGFAGEDEHVSTPEQGKMYQ